MEDGEDCTGLPVGLYGLCGDCAKLLVCLGGGSLYLQMSCPEGSELDVNLGVCVPAGQAACG